MKIKLAELVSKFDLKLIGRQDYEITGVSTLENATAQDISFLANTKYASLVSSSNAGALIVDSTHSQKFQGNVLIAKDPYVAFAKVAALFQNQQKIVKGVHPSAVIAKTANIGKNVSIGPLSIIGENAIIADNTVLQERVTIGNNCKIGKNCILKTNSVIAYECDIGDNVIIHQGAIIGADGFGLARDSGGWIKVPQLGAVIIGNNCEIGANTTIDRGTLENTILEEDVRLDNQIQIAHNVIIGAHTVMAGCSAVAGSAKIGKNCLIGGGVGIIGHLQVCDNVTLQSMALVTRSITKPGSYSSVSPLQETTEWRKSAVRLKQLDKIARKVGRIEKLINQEITK